MNCNTTHYRANSSSVPGDPTEELAGFNVLVGGKMGSGGFRAAEPLDAFARPEQAAAICRELVLIFRDFGPRETRSRARFAFLIEERGLDWVRTTLEERLGELLPPAGIDRRSTNHVDHVGVTPQRQPGLNAVGLVVPIGRFTADQMDELARLADAYGKGEVRLTTDQNVVIPHVPDHLVPALSDEPLVQEWTPEVSPAIRGLISCTGTEFCNLALIETKARALETAKALAPFLTEQGDRSLRIRWSGCPAACGNHLSADIGLQGKRIRLADGRVVEAVTIFAGGRGGPDAMPARVVHEDVICDEHLPGLLAQLAVREEVYA